MLSRLTSELLALNGRVVIKTLGSERKEQKERGSVGGSSTMGPSKVKRAINERISYLPLEITGRSRHPIMQY